MTLKTLLLGAAMTGALMAPALAMAADAVAPVAKTEAAKEAPKDAPAVKGEDKAGKYFESFDANKDGGISQDEFINHRKESANSKLTPDQIAAKKKERFAEIDTNKDGKIDQAEFKAFGEKMHAKREEHKEEKKAEPAPTPAAK